MTFIGHTDFLIEVQKGNVAGHSMVHKFGRNDAVGAAWEHISLLPFVTSNFRSSASTMRIKAGGDVADTVSGTGATAVVIQGIDSTFAESTDTLSTVGDTDASAASTVSFWRLHRAWVNTVGGYGNSNAGVITIEDSSGSADIISIEPGEGQGQYSGYTIPTGKTGYLLSVHVTTDGAKAADVRCMTREDIDDTSADMPPARLKLYWDGILGSFDYKPKGPELSLAAKTDIWFEAKAGASTEVSCNFELLLVDD